MPDSDAGVLGTVRDGSLAILMRNEIQPVSVACPRPKPDGMLSHTPVCTAHVEARHPQHAAETLTQCGCCRWKLKSRPEPEHDLAVKRIQCTTVFDVQCVQHELDVLDAANDCDHCIGNKGCFCEP